MRHGFLQFCCWSASDVAGATSPPLLPFVFVDVGVRVLGGDLDDDDEDDDDVEEEEEEDDDEQVEDHEEDDDEC